MRHFGSLRRGSDGSKFRLVRAVTEMDEETCDRLKSAVRLTRGESLSTVLSDCLRSGVLTYLKLMDDIAAASIASKPR
jgi:hypothetical protein